MTSTTSTTRTDHQVEIHDRMVITDLVYRLGVCLDEGRFDDLHDLAIEGAAVRTPGGESVGREAFVAQARRNHPADQAFHHVTTNVLIDLDGDQAKVRANLLVHITELADLADDAPGASRPAAASARCTTSTSSARPTAGASHSRSDADVVPRHAATAATARRVTVTVIAASGADDSRRSGEVVLDRTP